MGRTSKGMSKSRNQLRLLGATDRDLQDVMTPVSQLNDTMPGDGGIGALQYGTDRNFKTLGAYDKLTISKPNIFITSKQSK